MEVSLKQKYTQYYSKFVATLPMDNTKFLDSLQEVGLFLEGTYDMVTAKPTAASRASEFLKCNIEPGFFLNDNSNESLDKLLKIMARSEFPKQKNLAELFGYSKSLLCMGVCSKDFIS